MKKHIGIKIFFAVIAIFTMLFVGMYIYQEMTKTPSEILLAEAKEAAEFYEENLHQALEEKKTGDFVVILNPVHGGTEVGYTSSYGEEQDIVLDICQLVDKSNNDADVVILHTRTSDLAIPIEMRDSFIAAIEPDMIIDVCLNKENRVEKYGTSVYYNTTYFNRKFTNQEFADVMEKAVVTRIEGIAAGIFEVTDEEKPILSGRNVPSVSIACGNIANDLEAKLFVKEGFQTNVALGILDGIYQAKEIIEEAEGK